MEWLTSPRPSQQVPPRPCLCGPTSHVSVPATRTRQGCPDSLWLVCLCLILRTPSLRAMSTFLALGMKGKMRQRSFQRDCLIPPKIVIWGQGLKLQQ